MGDVILKNITKHPPRMLVLHLTKATATVKVVNRTTQEARDGTRRSRTSTKLVPDTLRIPSGQSVRVPEDYLRAPDVAAAIAAQHVEVMQIEAPIEPKVAPTATTSDKKRRR